MDCCLLVKVLPCRLKKVLGSKSSGSKPSASSHTSFSWFWLPCNMEAKSHLNKIWTKNCTKTWQKEFLFTDKTKTHHVWVPCCHLRVHLDETHRVVDFRVVSMLLLHLLVVLLLSLSFVLVQCLQVFPPVVLFHHFIPLELIVSLFVIVLQIFSGLDAERKKKLQGLETWDRQSITVNIVSEIMNQRPKACIMYSWDIWNIQVNRSTLHSCALIL